MTDGDRTDLVATTGADERTFERLVVRTGASCRATGCSAPCTEWPDWAVLADVEPHGIGHLRIKVPL